MKKTIICAVALLSFLGTKHAGAQTNTGTSTTTTTTTSTETTESSVSLKSKKGYEILPQAGDYALGIGASTTLSYFGNLLNGTEGTDPDAFNYVDAPYDVFNNNTGLNQSLFLKKFTSSTSAYRVRIQAIARSNRSASYVSKDELSPDLGNPQYVTDYITNRQMGLLVGAGMEKRRGTHRIQGVYGAEAFLGVFNSQNSFEYGNPFSANFPQPTISGAFTNGARMTKQSFGTGFTFGVRPFIGVEYFFAPKMSIGGEFGYNLSATLRGNTTITSERFNPATGGVDEIKTVPAGTGNGGFAGFGLSTNNIGGAINLLFHF